MASKSSIPSSTTPRPSAPTASDALVETQVFWARNQGAIIAALVVVLCALAAYGAYRVYVMRRDDAAATLLASAKTAPDYQKVIADYPGSPSAPSATLLLAQSLRQDKKFAEANAALEGFLKRNPKHELVTTAEMAMAANMDSLGKTDDALTMYRRIAAEHPRDFNAPLALLGQVHLLKQKGQIEEARQVCETVLTQYRESYASQEASQYLRTLKPATPAATAAPANASATPANSPVVTASSAPSVAPVAASPAASTAPTP